MRTGNVRSKSYLSVVTRRNPIFAGVDDAVMQRIRGQGRERVCFPGEEIAREESEAGSFFLVETGSVRVFSTSENGIEVTHQVLRAPAVFGVGECLHGLAFTNSAEPLEKTRVLAVPRRVLLDAIEISNAFACNLLRDISARLCVATHRQKTSALFAVAPQVAQILTSYAEAFGLPVDGGTKIRIPLSQHSLANALGVASRSVARALKVWIDEGTVAKRGRYYIICDSERLARAGSSSGCLPMIYSSDDTLNRWFPHCNSRGRRRRVAAND